MVKISTNISNFLKEQKKKYSLLMEKKTAQSQVFLFVREPDVGGILSAVLEINKLKLQKSISPSL